MEKSKKKLFLLFISSFIFFLAGLFLSLEATRFKREGVEVQAEIVRIEREYDAKNKEEISVFVEYTV